MSSVREDSHPSAGGLATPSSVHHWMHHKHRTQPCARCSLNLPSFVGTNLKHTRRRCAVNKQTKKKSPAYALKFSIRRLWYTALRAAAKQRLADELRLCPGGHSIKQKTKNKYETHKNKRTHKSASFGFGQHRGEK